MPSFSISQFTILPGPLQGSAEFLLLSTGPLLYLIASPKNPTRRWRYQNKTIVLFFMDSSIKRPASGPPTTQVIRDLPPSLFILFLDKNQRFLSRKSMKHWDNDSSKQQRGLRLGPAKPSLLSSELESIDEVHFQ